MYYNSVVSLTVEQQRAIINGIPYLRAGVPFNLMASPIAPAAYPPPAPAAHPYSFTNYPTTIAAQAAYGPHMEEEEAVESSYAARMRLMGITP